MEQVLGRQAQALLASTADHLKRDDGVATQLEEVILAPYPLHTEHFGPDGGEDALVVGLRRLVALALPGRLRQRGTIQLAGRGQRQLGQGDDLRRDHIVRQGFRQFGAQSIGVAVVASNHIAHQLFAGRRLAGDHRRFLHAVECQQLALDLAQFDTEATDLHLMVDAA